MATDEQPISAREVCAQFPITRNRLYDLVQQKRIRHFRAATGRVSFLPSDVRAFLDAETGTVVEPVVGKR